MYHTLACMLDRCTRARDSCRWRMLTRSHMACVTSPRNYERREGTKFRADTRGARARSSKREDSPRVNVNRCANGEFRRGRGLRPPSWQNLQMIPAPRGGRGNGSGTET